MAGLVADEVGGQLEPEQEGEGPGGNAFGHPDRPGPPKSEGEAEWAPNQTIPY